MDCWDEMGVPQKTRTAKDLARVMAEMLRSLRPTMVPSSATAP